MKRISGSGVAIAVISTLCLSPLIAGAQAQNKSGGIVCWKDASGKVIGCGDKVPPEYLNSATKEMDKQGNVRKSGESAAEAAKRRAREAENAKQKSDEDKRIAEQKRQDSTLLATFANEKEIDLKRDRELYAIDQNLGQQQAALKNANERLADANKRNAKGEITRAESDKKMLEQGIAAKEKEKGELRTKYAEYRKRYMELKGIPAEPAAAPAAKAAPSPTAAAPAATSAPAKK